MRSTVESARISRGAERHPAKVLRYPGQGRQNRDKSLFYHQLSPQAGNFVTRARKSSNSPWNPDIPALASVVQQYELRCPYASPHET
jgi:hypothetical protein